MALPDCVEVANSHGQLCVPVATSHRPGVRVMLAGKVYEPFTIDFICRNAGEGDVIHAGAFCGDFLPALAKALSGTIWAFEPVPEYFACAERTIEINGISNVRLMNAGLSDAKGQTRMRTVDEQGRDSGGASRIDPGGDTTIAIVCLDDVIPADRHVSIIHLDVEGHERAALEGAMGIISRCRPVLILESDAGIDLAGLGYRYWYRVHNNSVYAVEEPRHAPLRDRIIIRWARAAKRRLWSLPRRLTAGR